MTCRRELRRELFPLHCLVLAVVLFPAVLCAADAVPAGPSSSSDGPSTVANGYLSTKYIYRTAEYPGARTSDQDVFADLRLDVTRPKDNRYEFHFLGSVRADLDGNQDVHTFMPLEDAGDTYGTRVTGDVYEAHVALNEPVKYVTQLRIGRQSGTRDEPVFFDGIAGDLGAGKLNLTLYGGAAMHFAEVDRHWGEDTVAGAGLDYTPLPSLGMSADYVVLKDEQALFPTDTTRHDRLLSFKAWQRFGSFTRVSEKYRFLEGAPRDLALRAVTASPGTDAEASVGYFRQFRTQNELSNDLSLFYDIIGRSAPYQSFDVKVRKLFAERFALDLGYYKRQLLDPADEGPFNKEFKRTFVDVEVMDLFLNQLSGTVLAEQWESQGRSYDAVGADLSYKFKRNKKEVKVSIGTNYSLYKYDYYTELGMREQVRTWYVNGKYPLSSGLSMNGSYEYEHGLEKYQTLRLGMRYDF